MTLNDLEMRQKRVILQFYFNFKLTIGMNINANHFTFFYFNIKHTYYKMNKLKISYGYRTVSSVQHQTSEIVINLTTFDKFQGHSMSSRRPKVPLLWTIISHPRMVCLLKFIIFSKKLTIFILNIINKVKPQN